MRLSDWSSEEILCEGGRVNTFFFIFIFNADERTSILSNVIIK